MYVYGIDTLLLTNQERQCAEGNSTILYFPGMIRYAVNYVIFLCM